MINETILERADFREAETHATENRASDRPSRSIASHVLFPIGMALWAATMLGGIVMALNNSTIARISAMTGLKIEPAYEKIAFAACAAVLGAAFAYVIASLARKKALRSVKEAAVVTTAGRRVRNIEPLVETAYEPADEELQQPGFAGSDTIEPLDITAMFDGDEMERVIEEQTEAHDNASLDDRTDAEPEIERRDMDLEEFGALPGRDAVWVREPLKTNDEPEGDKEEAGPTPEEMVAADPAPHPTALMKAAPDAAETARLTALEKLRSMPLQELSLVQMVERFAAALSEHQARTEKKPEAGPDLGETAEREAALVEALRALSVFSSRGLGHPNAGQRGIQAVDMVSETEQELRQALAKLQTLRGAA